MRNYPHSRAWLPGAALVLVCIFWIPVDRLTANNILMLPRAAAVQCVGSIQDITRLHAYGAPAQQAKGKAPIKRPAPLVPGLSWIGNHELLAAASFGGVEWKLSADYKTHTMERIPLPSPPVPAIRLLHSNRGIFICSLGARDGYRELKFWLRSPHSPGGYRESQIRTWRLRKYARPPSSPWMSLECPKYGDWFCALPDIQTGQSFGILGYFPPAAGGLTTFPLGEPHNHAFCSPDGRFLGLVSGGHWLRVLRVGRAHADWRMIRVQSRVPLRFGAFSRDGDWAVLTTASRGRGPVGGPVEIILLNRRKPGVEWITRPWGGQLYRALASCPPAISPKGRQIAADIFRPRGLVKPHGQGIFLYSGNKRGLAGIVRLKGDLAQRMAFSPDGKYLAVECWYRIILFRCRPAGSETHRWNIDRGMREVKLAGGRGIKSPWW